jgi:hypothetical protein
MQSELRPRNKYINYNIRSEIKLNEWTGKKRIGDKESYEGTEQITKVNNIHIKYLI